MHHEKRQRSLLKALTYRLFSIISDSFIAYFFTRSTTKTFYFVVFSNTVSLIFYFVHERAWNRVHWGKHTIEIEVDKK